MRNPKRAIRAAHALLLAATVLPACSGEDPTPDAVQPSSIVTATRPPPPISGGTLLVARDGVTAIAADSDRDRVSLVDLRSKTLLADLPLEPLDEPGRVVEGPPGFVQVALRRAGAIVTIDLDAKRIVRRTPVCAAPRGLVYVEVDDALHIACAGGELVTVSATTFARVRRLQLPSDLRDVAIDGDTSRLLVTRFRSAELLWVFPDGAVQSTPIDDFGGFSATVAWRMVPLAGGNAIVHQRPDNGTIPTNPGGYGTSQACGGGGIVQTTVSFVGGDAEEPHVPMPTLSLSALPVDMATSPDGSKLAIVAAGSNTFTEFSARDFRMHGLDSPCSPWPTGGVLTEGQPVAVAYSPTDLVIQLREPPALRFRDGTVLALPGESVFDTGHELFHRPPNPALSLACASCHPEGRDDGRVWHFDDTGARRTQSVAGGILATAPLHWDGRFGGLGELMEDVFTSRMSGTNMSSRRVAAIGTWLDTVPLLPASPPADVAGVARGEALFSTAGCATCHSGPRFTNNTTVDVGTGLPLQVPSLRGVGARAPYMHDGCAATLRQRLEDPSCGGGDSHGVTSNLTAVDVSNLVAYLETL